MSGQGTVCWLTVWNCNLHWHVYDLWLGTDLVGELWGHCGWVGIPTGERVALNEEGELG